MIVTKMFITTRHSNYFNPQLHESWSETTTHIGDVAWLGDWEDNSLPRALINCLRSETASGRPSVTSLQGKHATML